MYRAEILGIHVPGTAASKTVDELTTSGSRLSNDSGYIDEPHSKNHGKLAEPAQLPAKFLEDWKISGTLDQLAQLQIETPVEAKSPSKSEAERNNKKDKIKIENDDRSVTLEDVQLKQEEDTLRLQRELFSSIANRNQPVDVVSRTLRALEADEYQNKDVEELLKSELKSELRESNEQKADSEEAKHRVEEKAHKEEDEKIDAANLPEQEMPKCLLSPNREKISDEEWQLLNTLRDRLEERKEEPSALLQVEQISVIPPTPRKEEVKQKRLKDLDLKRENKDSTSTDSSSLDTEAEQQKLSEMGSNHVLMKSTLVKMHKEIERLTLDQRELCRSCFQKIEKQPIPFGLSIMIRLFSNHPQYKDIWPQFKQIPDSSLMHAPELRRHARIYMAGLRLIINSMNDDDKLETALRGIAQAHVKWHIHKYHLINMLPCVIEAFQTKFPMSVDQVQSWTTLFDVIANLIDIFRSH